MCIFCLFFLACAEIESPLFQPEETNEGDNQFQLDVLPAFAKKGDREDEEGKKRKVCNDGYRMISVPNH